MKTKIMHKFSICFIVVLLAHWMAEAQTNCDLSTNDFSYNATGFSYGKNDLHEGYFLIYRQMNNVPIVETFPAAKDTGGNWGMPADNLALSIRLRRSEFLVGEPVTSVIILRNLDTRQRGYFLNDFNIKASLFHGTNEVVYQKQMPQRKQIRGEDLDGLYGNLKGRSEAMFTMAINHYFELKQPGAYSFQVQIQEPTSDGDGKTNVISGKARFRIVEKLSPPEVAAKNSYEQCVEKVLENLRDRATNDISK